ncbi:MAG: TfoX/Sxy family protein [Chitinophagales bacterium]
MAYNEQLAERIQKIMNQLGKGYEVKKMFGGVCYMISDKMTIGIVKDDIMVRVITEKYEKSLLLPHCRVMDFTGRVLKNFLYVEAAGLKKDSDLKKWILTGIEFAEQPKEKRKSKKK